MKPVSGGFDHGRTLRGTLCGAVAAAVWGLQQPLDKRLFHCEYDDVELLGRAVTSGDSWYPVGFAMHMGGGAAFGAAYANIAPTLPIPPVLRGPAAALFEHLALWPLGAVSDRIHPARQRMPRLSGNRAAFLQAAWRHLLFGFVLGELERRANAAPTPDPEDELSDFSSNGHGSLEHAVSAQPSS